MNIDQTSYRSYLRDLLIEKKKTNPQFSLRSLAKIFELLVKYEKAHQVPLRDKILESLKEIDPSRSKQRDLSIDQFSMIASWHHYVIFMLIDIEDFKWTLSHVSRVVGVSSFEVKQALERLKALALIDYHDENTRPEKKEPRILVNAVTPNEAIQRYHIDMLKKTEIAIKTLSRKERFNGSEILILSESQLQEANEILEECYRKIFSLTQKKAKKKNVYQMGIHLFPLTQIEKKGIKK